MSPVMSHPSFSISLFAQLVRRLRLANSRYVQIAYQCRCSRSLTHHAKRRAYRAGLRIDTSKARATWPEGDVYLSVSVSATSVPSFPVSSMTVTAGIPARTVAETETKVKDGSDGSVGLDTFPNPWSELGVVVQKLPATCLSPLELELRNVDDVMAGQVPGAPRWLSKPLPEVEREWMTKAVVSPEVSCTYDRVWRGVMRTHVLMPVDPTYGGLGITISRKREDDVSGAVVTEGRGTGTWIPQGLVV